MLRMLIQSFDPCFKEVAISCISDFTERGLSRDRMPGNKNQENHSICAQFQLDSCGESFLRKRRPDGDLCSFNCPRRYSQLSTSHAMSQNHITFVYKRRRQNANSITICTTQPCAVIKPVHLVAAHEHTTSVPELVTEANRSPVGHPVEYNKGVREPHNGIAAREEAGSEEALVSEMGGILNLSCAKDDCSSSKSNMELSSAFLRFDNDGACECSSSGACINENLPADMSEREKCISILRSQGLCERLGTAHNQAFAENTDMAGEKYCLKPCKICENLESTSKMLICDDCEDSFHLSCCNPHIMRIPVGEWLCSSCLKKNHKILKDKSTIHSVNLTNEFHRNEISESEGELGSLEFLFRDTEPYMSNVKIGDEFQADVPDWSGPIDAECDPIGDPSEITSPKNLILQEQNSVRTLKLSSIGNWLRCQEVIEGIGEGVDGTICGKWRRAPLFEVHTDDWGCFDSVRWDPTHSDCAVPQELETEEVMKQLKYIEKPQGAASDNFLIQYAVSLVLKESFKLYCTINDGIAKLNDKFFKMAKHDAVQVLDIYRRAAEHTELLAGFYKFCKTLALARTSQFPILRQLPPSFLATMEGYVKEAPRIHSVSSNKQLEYRVTEEARQKSEQKGIKRQVEVFENNLKKVDSKEKPDFINEKGTPTIVSAKESTDLIASSQVNPKAMALDQSNALALAIIQSDYNPESTNDTLMEIGKMNPGWELALVTAPSEMNRTRVTDSKMAGGFNELLLDSLYEDNVARRQIQLHRAGYSTCHRYETTIQNTLTRHNPFAMSNNNVVPSSNLQMSMMHQHDQQMMFHQQESTTMMVPWNPYPLPQMGSSNPFGGPFIMSSEMGNHRLL